VTGMRTNNSMKSYDLCLLSKDAFSREDCRRSFFGIRPGQIVNERNKAVGAARLALTKEDIFLPSVYIPKMVRTLERFRGDTSLLKTDIDHEVTINCQRIGIVQLDETEKSLSFTSLGQRFIKDDISRMGIIRDFLLSLPYVSRYMG